jgi:hypothetical protein
VASGCCLVELVELDTAAVGYIQSFVGEVYQSAVYLAEYFDWIVKGGAVGHTAQNRCIPVHSRSSSAAAQTIMPCEISHINCVVNSRAINLTG